MSENEKHAKSFAEFIRMNNWSSIPKSEDLWFNITSGEKLKTTDELYMIFLNKITAETLTGPKDEHNTTN